MSDLQKNKPIKNSEFPNKKELFASIIESSDDAIITKDSAGIITSWNKGAERIYGYQPSEVIGKPVSILVPPGQRDEVPEILDRINRGGSAHHYEIKRVRKDGKVIDVSMSISPMRDLSGNVIGSATIARDISSQVLARDQAKSAAESERKRFNDVLDTLPIYVVLLTPDYHAKFANRFFRERFGEARGKRCFELLFGRDKPCERCESYTVFDTKKPHHWEWVGPDGHFYDVFDFPFTDSDGSSLIMELGIDITERKKAEEALKMASAYNRSLIEASLDPLVTIGPDGKITDVNASTEMVTGLNRKELVGTDFSDYFTEPGRAREGYQRVFREGLVRDYALEIRRRDGHITPVLYNASVYRDDSGHVLGVFASARDVTTQERASQYSRSLIESSLDPLVTISAGGKIQDVNEATIKVTGVPREELVGTDFSNYFTEPDKAREGYQQVFAKGFVTDYPLTIRRRDGHLTPVMYNASVYRDARGNVLGVFAAARDITDQKKAEDELAEQRRKELERLAELEKFQRLTVGRELRMVELKKEIERLKQEIEDSKNNK